LRDGTQKKKPVSDSISANHHDPVNVRHLINGQWVDTPDHDATIDPYRGDVVSRVAQGGPEIAERAIASAAAAAPMIAGMPGYERAEILQRVGDLIAQRSEEIGRLMARETGKALKDAIGEVQRSQDTMALSAQEAIRIEGAQVPLDGSRMGAGKLAFLIRFPVGVVGAITPFNAPFNLACHKLGPAIGAGNAIVLKAPPQAAGVVHALAGLFVEAGVPEGVVNVVHGGADMGRTIVCNPSVDFVTFTGSSRVGAEIKAASGLRRVALELGGNGWTIIHEDADIDDATPMCARNAMRLAGQSCISVQSVLVHRSLYSGFVERVVAEAEALEVGDPVDPQTDVGTLIDETAAKRVAGWIDEAVGDGAKLLTGGKRTGAQLTPAVLTDVSADMKMVSEEVFGPAVSILAYDELDEAIAQVNGGPYGLQCGIFTRSNAVTMRAIREIRCGGVIINGTSTWRTDQLAYGGIKASGMGREGPRYAMRDMTDERLVVFNM
jgi:acyl-CoA reductase-like NAD-dependent aldehyde dehydrogenase